MKKSKIIVPALGILVLSTAASITGTVAWFSVNNSVTVNGMQVTTKVSSNLLIAETNAEDQYGSALTQSRVGTLEPASTVDGVSYFYTTDANADGSKHAPLTGTDADPFVAYSEAHAQAHTAAGKTAYDEDFNEAYLGDGVSVTTSNVVYGYIDYSFYLKATNALESTAEIRMTKCNLLYDNKALNSTDHSDAGLAWRVAVFAKDSAKTTATTDEVAVGNHKSILGLSGYDYFVDAGEPAKPQAAASATTRANVSNLDEAVTVKTAIASGATVYEKVTVRLWLEGEDKSCNNDTYAKLTNSWKLDLAFGIVATGAAASSVTAISSVVA